MTWSTSVRVVNDDGEPIAGAKVTIIFGGLSGYDTEYTGSDGWVEFEYERIEAHEEMWVTDIYIDGDKVAGDFYLSDGDTNSYSV